MAVVFTYVVSHQDGTQKQIFKNQHKAEEYAVQIKHTPEELIKIVRTAKGYEDFIYYI